MTEIVEYGPIDDETAAVVASSLKDHVRLLQDVVETLSMDGLQRGLPEDLVPHVVIRSLISVAALYGLCAAELEGRAPSRERWMGACGATYDEAAVALQLAKGGAS